ncbi:MAG: hypothetical protein ACHQRJ_22695 [Alphaproteobacteria bacterium]
MAETLVPYVDKAELSNAIVRLLLGDQKLFAEVENLFFRDDAPYEAGGVPHYLFVLVEGPASEAVTTVRFRCRDANERLLALSALDRDFRKAGSHERAPPMMGVYP